MNLFGFAGGDPVNFSDPFGLCKAENGDERPCVVSLQAGVDPTTVDPRVLLALYELADRADVDLEVSSLRRPVGDDFSYHAEGAGQAFDISGINGIDIGQNGVFNPAENADIAGLVTRVQLEMTWLRGVRENYGPAFQMRGNEPRPSQAPGHQDHIHGAFRFVRPRD